MAKQSPKQRKIVGRVMHEFKHGGLESSSGRKVKNPRQAIAIALHEAGASRDETPAANRRNLARTEHEQRKGGGRKAAGPARGRSGGDGGGGGGGGGGDTRAALYAEAAKRGIPGRSRMTKAQLARALHR